MLLPLVDYHIIVLTAVLMIIVPIIMIVVMTIIIDIVIKILDSSGNDVMKSSLYVVMD